MVFCEIQPQGDYIDLHRKRYGYRPDHFERKRKKEARLVHKRSETAQKVNSNPFPLFFVESDNQIGTLSLFCSFGMLVLEQALGIKGKMFAKKRYAEKALMKKT